MYTCTYHPDCQIYHLGESGERPADYEAALDAWTELLTPRCSKTTKYRVYNVLRYDPHVYNERLFWHTGTKRAEYTAGQSYPCEIRNYRHKLVGR